MATLQMDLFTTDVFPHDYDDASFIGTCKACKRTSKRTRQTLTYTGHRHVATCANGCSYRGYPVEVEYRKIEGTYKPGVRCGFKCQTATGPVCECSCNGKNHGGR